MHDGFFDFSINLDNVRGFTVSAHVVDMVSHTSALRNLLWKLLYLQGSSSTEVKELCTMVLNYSSGSLGEDAIVEVH